jgi:hypothetical protein
VVQGHVGQDVSPVTEQAVVLHCSYFSSRTHSRSKHLLKTSRDEALEAAAVKALTECAVAASARWCREGGTEALRRPFCRASITVQAGMLAAAPWCGCGWPPWWLAPGTCRFPSGRAFAPGPVLCADRVPRRTLSFLLRRDFHLRRGYGGQIGEQAGELPQTAGLCHQNRPAGRVAGRPGGHGLVLRSEGFQSLSLSQKPCWALERR